MKILITGSNGYLGQGIVRELLNRGIDVVATDFNTQYVDKRAQRVDCNLFEIEDPFNYFGQPDVLLHLAWRDGFVHNSPNHMNDLPCHYKFLEKMADGGVERLCVMGSMHEVGFYEGSINENTPCHPMSLYGISKNALRNCVELLAKKYNIEWQWLRAYYIVGNSQFGSSIFSKIAIAVKNGDKVFPFTMGLNQFDFLDYDKFTEQVASSVCQNEINGIINICSGRPEKLADRVERFIKDNNYDILLNYGMFPDRAYDSKALWGDNTKISKILKHSK